jgi:hypothetical protein
MEHNKRQVLGLAGGNQDEHRKKNKQQQLISSTIYETSQPLLPRRITFHSAAKPDAGQDALREKLIPINRKNPSSSSSSTSASQKSSTSIALKENDILFPLIPKSKICLFSRERANDLQKWQKVRKIGVGLHNLGNTCFLNAVLQCLTYTPPLANYMLTREHSSSTCRTVGFCIFCTLEKHMCQAINGSGAIAPRTIAGNLKGMRALSSPSLHSSFTELLALAPPTLHFESPSLFLILSTSLLLVSSSSSKRLQNIFALDVKKTLMSSFATSSKDFKSQFCRE